jgi:NAD(P)-dependent dehydrogenase (short-subunit alcohol dehydrogenase family)
MLLQDQIVFVTGSSRGIGRAIALEAAREGADVIVHYRASSMQADEVVAAIHNIGRQAVALKADWGNPNDVCHAAQEAWDAFGRIDVLVNNAGISIKNHILDVSLKEFETLWHVNVRGPFLVTQEIARRMVKQNIAGRILTVTSVNGLKPGFGFSAYGGTKGALEAMMKGIALDLSPHGITVNTLAVGAVKTDMNAVVLHDPDALKMVEKGIPLGRMGSPQEIAELTCALISSHASYMTGSTIVADGGLLMMRGYSPPQPYIKK